MATITGVTVLGTGFFDRLGIEVVHLVARGANRGMAQRAVVLEGGLGLLPGLGFMQHVPDESGELARSNVCNICGLAVHCLYFIDEPLLNLNWWQWDDYARKRALVEASNIRSIAPID